MRYCFEMESITEYARLAIENMQTLINECPQVKVDDIVQMLAMQGYIAQQAAFELIAESRHLDPVKKAKRLVIANQLMITAEKSLIDSGNLLCRSGKKVSSDSKPNLERSRQLRVL